MKQAPDTTRYLKSVKPNPNPRKIEQVTRPEVAQRQDAATVAQATGPELALGAMARSQTMTVATTSPPTQ